MSITEQTSITEIAASQPSSVRVFQRHGIDFCCGGKQSIGAACREHGLSFSVVAKEIESAARQPDEGEEIGWSERSLPELIEHILTAFHEPLRDELPRLLSTASKVAREHGDREPMLRRVKAVLTQLALDLDAHMQKEETILFPAIDAILVARPPFVGISAPIAVMEHEHDRAGELLAELRSLTHGYRAPGWACPTLCALYQGLADLDATMHVHVHLENNVLFPRALRMVGVGPVGTGR